MQILLSCVLFAAADAKVELGRQLFFDKRLSVDGSRACYSCHQNEDGTGGHEATAIGAKDKKLTRHSPVMWNVAKQSRFYWDGRAGSLEAQAKAAWAGGNMGVGNDKLEEKAKEVAAFYEKAFAKAYPGEAVTADLVTQALAEYERTIVCENTAYDRFKAGDAKALNAEQKKGLALFEGKAACASCHPAPAFSLAAAASEGIYFNVGIGTKDKADAEVDVGRMSVTKQDADWAAFKVPTLRNIAKSAPYFHDGSVAKLSDAVKLMASGGIANKNLSPLLQDRKLDDAELAALTAFLKALDCPGKL